MNSMQQIHLRGIVGMCNLVETSDVLVMNFSMATNMVAVSPEGTGVIQTTWHHVRAIQGGSITGESLRSLKRGDSVDVVGHYTVNRYVDADGNDRTAVTVIADKIDILDEPVEDEPVPYGKYFNAI